MKTLKIATVLLAFLATHLTLNSQVTFETTVTSTDGYDVNIEVQLLSIVTPQNCPNGYNFNVELGYDITFSGNNIPANLWTLQGSIINCGDASSIFFDLPNQGGFGTMTTTTNPWRSQLDCATASLTSFGCEELEILISGPGIQNQTISLTGSGSGSSGSSPTNWTLSGNKLFTENTLVGIGTSNPTNLLTVNGDALINGTLTTGGLNVLQKIQADTIKGAIRVDVNGNLMLGEEDGYNGITSRQEELRINSRPGYDHNVVINANTNGNLGIGVTNPQEKFDLFGNARLSGDMIFSSYADSASNEDKLLFVDKNGKTIPKKINDLALEMYLEPLACFQGYKPMWYNDEGKLYTGHLSGTGCETNVGIGTADPESKLHVIGLTRTSRLHVGHYNQSNTALLSGYRIGSLNSSQSIVTFGRHLNSVDFNYFDLRMDGTLRLRNQTRDVFLVNVQEESVYARKIVVDEEIWPDYVFDEKYELMSLDEVKEYIKEHGHLPNVPSATNVEENGVNLGEMAKITLEKVEELTLYILQQQELLEKQQGLLEKQQEEIERLKAEVKN